MPRRLEFLHFLLRPTRKSIYWTLPIRVVEQNRTANGALFAKCADCHQKQPAPGQALLTGTIRALREKRSVCGSVPLGSGALRAAASCP